MRKKKSNPKCGKMNSTGRKRQQCFILLSQMVFDTCVQYQNDHLFFPRQWCFFLIVDANVKRAVDICFTRLYDVQKRILFESNQDQKSPAIRIFICTEIHTHTHTFLLLFFVFESENCQHKNTDLMNRLPVCKRESKKKLTL